MAYHQWYLPQMSSILSLLLDAPACCCSSGGLADSSLHAYWHFGFCISAMHISTDRHVMQHVNLAICMQSLGCQQR